MKEIFLVNYSVNGIKTIDRTVSLSFYNKIIKKPLKTKDYNIKGIYGMNGSGKSGIVASVEILRNLLTYPGYLNNPVVQRELSSIINKTTQELNIEVEFMSDIAGVTILHKYVVALNKDMTGKYVITKEQLMIKPATSKSDYTNSLFIVEDGKLVSISDKDSALLGETIRNKSVNLLGSYSLCGIFIEKILTEDILKNYKVEDMLFNQLCILFIFGKSLHVYMDQSDKHTDFELNKLINSINLVNRDNSIEIALLKSVMDLDNDRLNIFSSEESLIAKLDYETYYKRSKKLCEFLRIFKSDLRDIKIDKKENSNFYSCRLVLVYDDYSIDAEYESTGIKKLIKLYAYLREMVQGEIVFIDEFDSNLHDVYLCALLEYLMCYAKGQLCFTTHNVGPMDILKQNKKSIDFLSTDHTTYPWTANGHYSPSNLYRNGMIEGSPFNVDSIDFIGMFDELEDED